MQSSRYFRILYIQKESTMQRRTPRIIAPAGNRESFSAAIHAGADAVYTGAPELNMRAGASIFSLTDIRSMTNQAHDQGAGLYLALNTILYDDDLNLAAAILDEAADIGVDAVILWDIAALALAHERGLTVHLSTQASVANSRSAEWYAELGVKSIVLARELSIPRIADTIARVRATGADLRFECFIHGALCVAVSGRCLTSQFLYGKSANRGECIQPCRRSYHITDDHNGHELTLDGHTVMSTKDLCTIDIIDRLMEAGIDAFKIEGRMRDARYVSETATCYREARDAVNSGEYTPERIKGWRKRLEGVYHRGFTHGFYGNDPYHDITYEEGNQATTEKVYLGRIDNYFPQAKAADIKLETGCLTMGDRLLITGPTTGAVEFTVGSLRSEDNRPAESVPQSRTAGVAVPRRVRENDRVFILRDNTRD